MHLSADLGALLGLASARAQLDIGVRNLWGPDVDVTRCEVLHLDRSIEAPALREATNFSLRLGLHDHRDHSFTEGLVHGCTRREGSRGELSIRRFPDDPTMPQLDELVDARRLLRHAPSAVVAHLNIVEPQIEVIDFRPGNCCTLRVSGERSAFATTFTDGRAARVAERLACLDSQLAGSTALAWARYLGRDEQTRTVWIEALPHVRSFVDYPPRRGVIRAPWQTLGRALAELHRAAAPHVECEDPASRLSRAQSRVDTLERIRCPAASAARLIVDLGSRMVSSLPAGDSVLLHGRLRVDALGRVMDRVAMFDVGDVIRGTLEQDFASLLVSLETLGIGRAGVNRAIGQVAASYVASGGRPPDRTMLDWHYRLQLIEHAWQDYQRNGRMSFGRTTSLMRRAQRSFPLEAT